MGIVANMGMLGSKKSHGSCHDLSKEHLISACNSGKFYCHIISRRIIFNRFSVDAISVCSFHPDIHMNGNSIISYICCIFLFYNVKIPDNSYAYVFLHRRPHRMQFQFIHLTIIFQRRFYLHRDFFILYRCLV